MKKILLLILILTSACASPVSERIVVPTNTQENPVIAPEVEEMDYFSFLSQPSCISGLTPPNQEGPYFKAGSPENTHLFVEGMIGEKLILVGRVLNEKCEPIADAKLDF